MVDLNSLSTGLSSLSSVISSVKTLAGMLSNKQKEDITRQLNRIEEQFQMSKTQIAQALGYELCRCTFPPQIMLYAGDTDYGERSRCPKCGREVSPDDMPPLDGMEG